MTDLTYFARLSYEWCVRCFGTAVADSSTERALRIVEEAVELAQVVRVPRELVERLVMTVYGRPVGYCSQEVGGIMVTLLVFCRAQGVSVESALQEELSRILSKDPDQFRKRQAEKEAGGVVG